MKSQVDAPHGLVTGNTKKIRSAGGGLLVVADGRVGAGGVDQDEIAEKFERAVALFVERGDRDVARRVSMLIADDAVGLRQDVDRAEVVAEEAVDEGGLASVDLAGDHEEERRAEAVFDFL